MKQMNQIEAILDVLTKKINHGSTFIQRRYDTGVAQFNLNDPVTEQAIQSFEKQFKLTLPSEYKTFLRLHDGAELFMIQGLGIELYPLEKVIEMTIQAKEYDLIHEDYDHFLMIGEMNEGYVLIHTEDAKTDETPYMHWMFHELSTEETDPIGQNFGTFLEYAIIAQGDMFWEFKDFSIATDAYYVEDYNSEEEVSKPRPIRFVDSVRVEIEYPIAKKNAYFSVKIFEGKQDKESLGASYDSDARFEKVMQSVREYLMAERFQYSSIKVFQTEHRFWQNEDETGDPLIRNHNPQRQGMSFDGYRAFVEEPPRPLPGWE